MTAPPCGHDYAEPAADGCAYCLIRDVAFHRERWTTGVTPATSGPPAVPNRGPCVHLGEPTGELRECETCRGARFA